MFKRATESDYEIMTKWYEVQNDHKFNADATGRESYVYFFNGTPMSSLSLFHSPKSTVAMIAWLIVNPIIKDAERTRAISSIIFYVEAIARGRGALGIVSYTEKPNAAKRLRDHGYVTAPIMQYQSYKWLGDKNV